MKTTALRNQMIRDLQIRRYSEGTIKSYISGVSRLARYFNKSPKDITAEEILAFQHYLVKVKKASWGTFNQIVCSIKFLYRVTLKMEDVVKQIPYQRKKKLFL